MRSALTIWGAGGHAREVAWACERLGIEVAAFVVDPGWTLGGASPPIVSHTDLPKVVRGLPTFPGGVGDPALKQGFAKRAAALNLKVCDPVVDPSAIVGDVAVGAGTFIGAGAIATTNIRIGKHVTINRGAQVSHDCVIGDFTTLSPGSLLGGSVTLEALVFIGIGASLREKVTVGEGSFVGGGSFVHRTVPPGATVAGVPARLVDSPFTR